MAGINISDFRQVFSFLKPTTVQNNTGGHTKTYTTLYTTRGAMRRMSGSRAFNSGYDGLVTVYEMFTYWRVVLQTELNKEIRVSYDGRNFAIMSFARDEENRMFYRFELTEVT